MARQTVFKDNPCEALGQLFSALSYIGDIRWPTFLCIFWHCISTDIVVAYFYFTNDHLWWGLITLLLVLLPGWIVAFFSIYWLIEDKRKPTPMIIFLHIICCGPLWRYYQAFNALRYQRPTFTGTFSEALSDVSMLRLIEGILESAPQVVFFNILYSQELSLCFKCTLLLQTVLQILSGRPLSPQHFRWFQFLGGWQATLVH